MGLKLVEASGLHPRPGAALPPDHLGLELELLARALSQLSLARGEEIWRWQQLAEAVLRRHIIPFARHFVPRLDEARPRPFYAAAGRALAEGLHACSALLAQREGPNPTAREDDRS